MFKRMLVPLDGSPLAECVLPHVVAMADSLGAKVNLLRVCEPESRGEGAQAFSAVDWQLKTTEADAYLEHIVTRLRGAGLDVQCQRLEGRAAEQIMDYAHQEDIDLILLSSHGRSGLTGWNISSIVQKIIARVHVSTMIVRAYRPGAADLRGKRYSRLLCPLDGSQRAEGILPLATALAHAQDAQVLLARVVMRPEMPRRHPYSPEELELIDRVREMNRSDAERSLQDIQSSLVAGRVDVTSRVVLSDDPAQSLHDLVDQEKVDLVLMSAHGYTGSTRWPYGSLALNFIVYGSTPLLIVQDLAAAQIQPTAAEVLARKPIGH
jgi:nucleotide-binding universal stress UspA family protein